MAVKEKVTGFRELLQSIKSGKFLPFYFLQGEEDYYIDLLVKEFETRVVPEDEKDFNLMTYYGADAEVSNVIASAQQFPVLSKYQLVFLKEAQAMQQAKSKLESFVSYIKNPNRSTVLVITFKGEGLNATSDLIKALKNSKDAILFKSDRIKDYQLGDPIRDYCRAKGFIIDEKAVTLLADYIGSPLSKLFGEIDRLIITKGKNNNSITAEDIEKNIGISKDFNTFELVKAIATKNYQKTMLIIKHFASNPKQNPGVMIGATLFNFFSKLLLAAMCKDKSDSSLMKELDLKNQYALRDYKDALRYYNAKSALEAVHFIREYDALSKGIGSMQNEFDLLRDLAFKIISYK